MQWPQLGANTSATWSPRRKSTTPGPSSSTMPDASWPNTMGITRGRSPLMTERSEWHRPAAAIFTSTSPGPGEVLVMMASSGLCHSDLSVINGDRPRPLPIALGHEAAGIVEEIGPGIADLQRGDHVALVFVASCGPGLPCLAGRPALCEPAFAAPGAGPLPSGHHRSHRADKSPINHQAGVSCFAEYAVVARGTLVKIDPNCRSTSPHCSA